jgi:predicted Rossmann-fold nucleotide-binding protein
VNAPGYEGKYIGNVTDTEVVTTNYIERMFKLMEYGDMFIIFKGGSGTVSEFGTAWVLAKLYYGHHKPFILYGDFWIEIVDAFRKNMNIDSKEMSVFEICRNENEVIATIRKFEEKIAQRNHDGDDRGDEYDKAFTK